MSLKELVWKIPKADKIYVLDSSNARQQEARRNVSDPLAMNNGVKQGDIPAPTSFLLYFTMVFEMTFIEESHFVQYLFGKLFRQEQNMSGESVKVAVRVRPFNQRELDRQAKLVIKMDGQQTSIINPDNTGETPKCFCFDYSYWSHDGFSEDEKGILQATNGSRYSSQQLVFNDLGKSLLNNAYEGYNCSLFAYGQTGSGKSYSMIGYGPNKGIVPTACDELFKTISSNEDKDLRYEVSFSMMEIYNEQVRDLLKRDCPKGGLQVRQHPKLGMFYVEDLQKVPVRSYLEIQKRMEQGTANRTVASTNMNATSSRAHTVVTIIFDQIKKSENNTETRKTSEINLVDLAGDRLREGANINRSLSVLGNVISALAEQASGKKKVVVPYRESVLTKLLKNALGGNSRTVMIAALSPADINYDETLSTLRYADRAKQIKNKAVVNENPIDKLIRELKEENERLKKYLERNGLNNSQDDEELRKELDSLQSQLTANQRLLAESTQTWEEKLATAQLMDNESIHGDLQRQSTQHHLVNLNEDPLLSKVIFHYLPEGKITVGSKLANPRPKICLNGLSIQKHHAYIENVERKISIEPASHNAKTKINGLPLMKKQTLNHMDRILFGSNHLYLFVNPFIVDQDPNLPKDISWEYAQKEIVMASGFADAMLSGLTKDQQITQEHVLEILPMVSEVNAMSDELNKYKSFEVILMSSAAQQGRGDNEKNIDVMVKMTDLLTENVWFWERGRFMNRRYLMQELYQDYEDGEDVSKIPQKDDPFWEAPEGELVGTANIFLQSLAYNLEFEDCILVSDYKGEEEGSITVNVAPCTSTGIVLKEETFVEDPRALLGEPFYFKVTIKDASVYKKRFMKGLKVSYRLNPKSVFTDTEMVKGMLNPVFNHSKQICLEWSQKPEEEQQFIQFWQSVSAVAKSTGTKFRTNLSSNEDGNVETSALGDKNEIISLYVFGEDEEELASELGNGNGLIDYCKVAHLCYDDKMKPKTELSEQYDALSKKFGDKIQNSVSCVIC
ncbi:KIF28P isoform X5 [Octopus vulgaris]|uniref:Kinesin-like protein 6 n=1 Tax=Octopus vulgaris TaxID=6645 RepID=A0AA36BQ80_OCTVU|nr:KIF28P isoform X5 [Octopus vulgaris]